MNIIDLAPVIAATWPAKASKRIGSFVVPDGAGGGNRVSAIRLADPIATGAASTDMNAALAEQQSLGQPPLAMVLDHQTELDASLAAMGLGIRDATLALMTDCKSLAAPAPPVTCFAVWPPLAIQEEIWADGGIGPARLAIMDRAAVPKTSFFGRIQDKPAASAFIGVHNGIAVLHALEVAPAYRRQGLAGIMMRAAAEWSISFGATDISVLVTEENTAARAVYTSLGFEAVGRYHYRSKVA